MENGQRQLAHPSKEQEAFLVEEGLGREALEALNDVIAGHRGERGAVIRVPQ